MGTDWVEKSTTRVGPPGGLAKSERLSSVLTNKRRSAGQSSKTWRTWSRRNLTPWKSCEWPRRPRNVSWECALYLSPPSHDISRKARFLSGPRTFRSGTAHDRPPPEPKHIHGDEGGRSRCAQSRGLIRACKKKVCRGFLSNGLTFGIWYELVTDTSNGKQVEGL